MSARRLWILVCPLLALAVAACGDKVQHNASAINDGVYINAGPITYQLQISRELNQYSTEDSSYLIGVPKVNLVLTPDQLWYGVFLWAKNQTGRTQTTASNFDIVDTQGNTYYPQPINTKINPFAWTAQTLEPNGIQPGPNTVASEGPTQGSLLLFKLNSSVYANRPLTLQIRGPSDQVWGTISLDL